MGRPQVGPFFGYGERAKEQGPHGLVHSSYSNATTDLSKIKCPLGASDATVTAGHSTWLQSKAAEDSRTPGTWWKCVRRGNARAFSGVQTRILNRGHEGKGNHESTLRRTNPVRRPHGAFIPITDTIVWLESAVR